MLPDLGSRYWSLSSHFDWSQICCVSSLPPFFPTNPTILTCASSSPVPRPFSPTNRSSVDQMTEKSEFGPSHQLPNPSPFALLPPVVHNLSDSTPPSLGHYSRFTCCLKLRKNRIFSLSILSIFTLHLLPGSASLLSALNN